MSLDCSFQKLIHRVDRVSNSSISDEVKLKRYGALIYQGSMEILDKAMAVFKRLQQPEISSKNTFTF